ncbi:MAG: acetyl-CoA decarbonylase/synthase complex subunit delta [Polyangia bacterium]|jgi:acetyl-CoA decarbonylase/synthase complex subunit delta|nr:acetyl-CoA decarbonylase/synthase complex subunit delta [Polyangia bacterium]
MVEIPNIAYSGSVNEVTVGQGGNRLTLGGETCYPFHLFEGKMPNRPVVAFEVPDSEPQGWPTALVEVYADVWTDPVAWARKCVGEFGAELIHLDLVGTDPNGRNLPASHAVEVAMKVAEAVSVPLAVWGSANLEKDTEVLRAVSEALRGKRVLIGPVQDSNYKQIGASIISDGHVAINSSPIDINLAKQLNILTENLGVGVGSIVMDPTTGGLGYGLEYTYSVMERCRQAALTQQDAKLQYPLYCVLGREVWKVKEAATPQEQAPTMGDAKTRGVVMEAVTAMSLLVAGADVLVVRHPETARIIRELICELEGR